MRIAVIRTDLPSALRLVDLEPVSQYNPPTEPVGQERYLARVTTTQIESQLADSTTGAGAISEGSDISGSFPLTITLATDDVLRLKTSSAASFTDVTIAAATYANLTDLLAAINAAIVTAGLSIQALSGTGSGDTVALESTLFGVDSYIEIDTVGNGSTANTGLGLSAGARTMPAASAFVTAAIPAGGPVDVSTATLEAVGAGTNSNALSLVPVSRGATTALADLLAPQFADTDVAIDSVLVGMVSEYASANYTPDPKLVATGAAVAVVENDGSTAFATTLPTITTATLNTPGAGDVTIAGTGLGSSEKDQTTLKFTGDVATVIQQAILVNAGGSVSDTAIVIPASLISGAATTTTSVQVKVRQRASAASALV